jgi:hypothetical protein
VNLGGLATGDEPLSRHLESRIETGQALRKGGVPVVEFRASVVIGSGSTPCYSQVCCARSAGARLRRMPLVIGPEHEGRCDRA